MFTDICIQWNLLSGLSGTLWILSQTIPCCCLLGLTPSAFDTVSSRTVLDVKAFACS